MTQTPTIERLDVDTAEDIKEFVEPYDSTDDPNHRTHVVRAYENGHIWQKGMTAKQVVGIARFRRIEVVAVCGHRWVPSHNPEDYQACEPCIKIAGEILNNPHSHD